MNIMQLSHMQWRTEGGGLGGSNPSRNSEVLTKLSRKPSSVENTSVTVYRSYSINLISLKIAEFRTPTPQDVRKKGSKILKLPRFVIVLH
jgi:hypothetical protein